MSKRSTVRQFDSYALKSGKLPALNRRRPHKWTRKVVPLGRYVLTEIFDSEIHDWAPSGFELSLSGRVLYRANDQTHPEFGTLSMFTFVDPSRLETSEGVTANPDSGSDGIAIVARDINRDHIPILIVRADTCGLGVGHEATLMIRLEPMGPREIYFGAPCLFRRQKDGTYRITSHEVSSTGNTASEAVYIDVPLNWDGLRYRPASESRIL